jgi:hypothetical protein
MASEWEGRWREAAGRRPIYLPGHGSPRHGGRKRLICTPDPRNSLSSQGNFSFLLRVVRFWISPAREPTNKFCSAKNARDMKTAVAIWALVAMAIVIVGFFALIVFDLPKGPLERTPMGDVYIEKGERLSSAAMKFESQIRASGGQWVISVDDRIADRQSTSSFGGGGSALLLGMLKERFSCNMVVVEKRHLIVLY